MDRRRAKGGARLKAVISLLILAVLVYAAIKIVPAYINNYELQDKMREEARFAGVQRKSSEDVRMDIFRKVQELGIPAHANDIRVELTPQGYRISLDYTIVVDFPTYQLTLHFHPAADSQSI